MKSGELADSNQAGYALLAVLLLMIIIGYALGEAGMQWSQARQRDREAELLKIGDKFRIAIGQYYNNTPGEVKQFPPTLQALLRDDRFPVPRRYLRQIYRDPFTGSQDWGTLISAEGNIMGVYSLGSQKPFKKKQFRPMYKDFENKDTYSYWIFAYSREFQQ